MGNELDLTALQVTPLTDVKAGAERYIALVMTLTLGGAPVFFSVVSRYPQMFVTPS